MKTLEEKNIIIFTSVYVIASAIVLFFLGTHDLRLSLYLTEHQNKIITVFGSRVGLLPSALIAAFCCVVLSKDSKHRKILLFASVILSIVAGLQLIGAYNTISLALIVLLCSFVFLSLIFYFGKKVEVKNKLQRNFFLMGLWLPLYANLTTKIFKLLWGRPRFLSLTNPKLEFIPWYHISGFAIRDDLFQSFPSGHTTSATCLLWLLFIPLVYPNEEKQKKILYVFVTIWIVLTALSRIMMGKHFLTDVCAGFLISLYYYLLLRARMKTAVK